VPGIMPFHLSTTTLREYRAVRGAPTGIRVPRWVALKMEGFMDDAAASIRPRSASTEFTLLWRAAHRRRPLARCNPPLLPSSLKTLKPVGPLDASRSFQTPHPLPRLAVGRWGCGFQATWPCGHANVSVRPCARQPAECAGNAGAIVRALAVVHIGAGSSSAPCDRTSLPRR